MQHAGRYPPAGGQVPNPHLRVSIPLHLAPKEPHLPHTRPGPGTKHLTSFVSGPPNGGPLRPHYTDKRNQGQRCNPVTPRTGTLLALLELVCPQLTFVIKWLEQRDRPSPGQEAMNGQS